MRKTIKKEKPFFSEEIHEWRNKACAIGIINLILFLLSIYRPFFYLCLIGALYFNIRINYEGWKEYNILHQK